MGKDEAQAVGGAWKRDRETKCFRLGLEQSAICLDQEMEDISSTYHRDLGYRGH